MQTRVAVFGVRQQSNQSYYKGRASSAVTQQPLHICYPDSDLCSCVCAVKTAAKSPAPTRMLTFDAKASASLAMYAYAVVRRKPRRRKWIHANVTPAEFEDIICMAFKEKMTVTLNTKRATSFTNPLCLAPVTLGRSNQNQHTLHDIWTSSWNLLLKCLYIYELTLRILNSHNVYMDNASQSAC